MCSRAGFVSNTGSDSVTLFDKQRRQVAAIILTCARPAGLGLDRQGGRLSVAGPRGADHPPGRFAGVDP